MKKLLVLIIFGAGYVLGAKAGRERYEQIRRMSMKVKNNPTVQSTAHQAAEMAKEQAPVAKDKFGEAAAKVKDKLSHDDSGLDDPTTGESTYGATYQGSTLP